MKDILELAKSMLKYSQENPEEMKSLNKQEPATKEPEIKEEVKPLSKEEHIKKCIAETEYTPVFQKSLEKDVIDMKTRQRLSPSEIKQRSKADSKVPSVEVKKPSSKKVTPERSAHDKYWGDAHSRANNPEWINRKKKKKVILDKEELDKMGSDNPKMGVKPAAHGNPMKNPASTPKISSPKPPKGGEGGTPASAPMMKDSDHVTEEKKQWKKDSYNKDKAALPHRDRRKEKKKSKYSKEEFKPDPLKSPGSLVNSYSKPSDVEPIDSMGGFIVQQKKQRAKRRKDQKKGRYSEKELEMAKKDCMGEYKPRFQKSGLWNSLATKGYLGTKAQVAATVPTPPPPPPPVQKAGIDEGNTPNQKRKDRYDRNTRGWAMGSKGTPKGSQTKGYHQEEKKRNESYNSYTQPKGLETSIAAHGIKAGLKARSGSPKANLPKSEIPANKVIKPKG